MSVENNIGSEMLKVLTKKNRLKRYTFLIIGCFLVAFAFNVFFKPHNLVIGGISGISILVNSIFNIENTTFITITYIVLLILSFILLGKEKTKYSIIGSILYPIFVYLTEDINVIINFNVDNPLLVGIFGALVYGLGQSLVFKYGFSTGGSDIIFQIMSKYFKISISDSLKTFNYTTVIISGFVIGEPGVLYAWENVMYAVIAIYIIGILNDKVLLGVSNSKAFYVITEHETSIKDFLIRQLGKGVTVLEARGGYTGDIKKVIMCAIPTKQYFLVKQGILEIDKNAIILINDVYQSSGLE